MADLTTSVMRALIVDDEDLARSMLRTLLTDIHDVEIIGEAADGSGAISKILEYRPDVVFLDIEMPGVDGLGVLQSVATEYLPITVFVTAHASYAARAFEERALDYLLKPVSPRRLLEILDRIRHRMRADAALEEQHLRTAGLLESESEDVSRGTRQSEHWTRLVAKDRTGYLIVHLNDVESLEAAGNYVRIMTAGAQPYLMRSTLLDLEGKLDPAKFARIHRSTLVNIDRVSRITPHPNGDYEVYLKGGRMVRMSRNYRTSLIP